MQATTKEQPQRPACEDIFTTEEAVAHLKLPSVRAFNGWRKQAKVRGIRVGNQRRYSREQLTYIRQYIFGMVKGGK